MKKLNKQKESIKTLLKSQDIRQFDENETFSLMKIL